MYVFMYAGETMMNKNNKKKIHILLYYLIHTYIIMRENANYELHKYFSLANLIYYYRFCFSF